jgi:hypothetical protein
MDATEVDFARFASHPEVVLAGQIALKQVPEHVFRPALLGSRTGGTAREVPSSGRAGSIGTTTENFWFWPGFSAKRTTGSTGDRCPALEHEIGPRRRKM